MASETGRCEGVLVRRGEGVGRCCVKKMPALVRARTVMTRRYECGRLRSLQDIPLRGGRHLEGWQPFVSLRVLKFCVEGKSTARRVKGPQA